MNEEELEELKAEIKVQRDPIAALNASLEQAESRLEWDLYDLKVHGGEDRARTT